MAHSINALNSTDTAALGKSVLHSMVSSREESGQQRRAASLQWYAVRPLRSCSLLAAALDAASGTVGHPLPVARATVPQCICVAPA
eukprot:20018-Heterococcus_DN1.PRE.3